MNNMRKIILTNAALGILLSPGYTYSMLRGQPRGVSFRASHISNGTRIPRAQTRTERSTSKSYDDATRRAMVVQIHKAKMNMTDGELGLMRGFIKRSLIKPERDDLVPVFLAGRPWHVPGGSPEEQEDVETLVEFLAERIEKLRDKRDEERLKPHCEH